MPNQVGRSSTWPQHRVKTLFLRVPSAEWARIVTGGKTEFRQQPGRSTLVRPNCPTPVVGYREHAGVLESQLLVLDDTWREPLGAITQESLEREGFRDFDSFRQHWMQRTKRRFRPLLDVQVYRVRVLHDTDEDYNYAGRLLLARLYGEHVGVR
jgi:hypothetical protein